MFRAAFFGATTSLALVALTTNAASDSLPAPASIDMPYSWTGAYVGTHTGGALNLNEFSNPYGSSLFGDEVRSPGPLAGIQIGYDKQYDNLVIGLETDVTWANLDGTFTCLQPSSGGVTAFPSDFTGGAFGATCRSRMDWFGTLTGKLGTTLGENGRTLLYTKGGLAWGHSTINMVTDNGQSGQSGPTNATTADSSTQLGWTVGAGLEYALTGNWSARVEYDFLSFGHDLSTPDSSPIGNPGSPGIEGSSSPDGRGGSVAQDVHAFKLGLNYRFGDVTAPSPFQWPAGFIVDTPNSGPRPFQIEIGSRYVHGWGRFQQDLATPNISRLTWDNVATDGGEGFWRIDGPHNVMIKGLWGAGGGDGGHINDEDWGFTDEGKIQPYQNTISSVDGSIRYFTIDVGYDWLKGDGYRLSPFIGYNYLRQDMTAHGIVLENFSPSQQLEPPNVVPLRQFTDWNSLRLGSTADLMLTSRLKLTAEAAYLPYAHFGGEDDHPLRTDVVSEHSPQWGGGKGVQLEALLTYDLTDHFSVGAGARYWAMWVSDGQTNNFSSGDLVPERFATEQTAVFAQGSYKFDVPCCSGP